MFPEHRVKYSLCRKVALWGKAGTVSALWFSMLYVLFKNKKGSPTLLLLPGTHVILIGTVIIKYDYYNIRLKYTTLSYKSYIES